MLFSLAVCATCQQKVPVLPSLQNDNRTVCMEHKIAGVLCDCTCPQAVITLGRVNRRSRRTNEKLCGFGRAKDTDDLLFIHQLANKLAWYRKQQMSRYKSLTSCAAW